VISGENLTQSPSGSRLQVGPGVAAPRDRRLSRDSDSDRRPGPAAGVGLAVKFRVDGGLKRQLQVTL
jgi:hypothetical protein